MGAIGDCRIRDYWDVCGRSSKVEPQLPKLMMYLEWWIPLYSRLESTDS